jgi:hypothetical protein
VIASNQRCAGYSRYRRLGDCADCLEALIVGLLRNGYDAARSIPQGMSSDRIPRNMSAIAAAYR